MTRRPNSSSTMRTWKNLVLSFKDPKKLKIRLISVHQEYDYTKNTSLIDFEKRGQWM